jgi:hypothetical protein
MKKSSSSYNILDSSLPVIGWQEKVELPELLIRLTAKVDTGARSSALHARDIEVLSTRETQMVRFKVEPRMTLNVQADYIEAKLLEQRNVKSSNGQTELRPVIKTTLQLGNETFEIELTLTNREMMGKTHAPGTTGSNKPISGESGFIISAVTAPQKN